MKRNEEKVKKAMELALERLDYIVDYYTTSDFVEVIGKIGGDDESGGEPARVQKGVWVNFFGTLICDQQLLLDEDKVLWLQDGDFVWL